MNNTEFQIFEALYTRHKKLLLSTKEMCLVVGQRYPSVCFLFESKTDEEILREKLIPTFKKMNKRRAFPLHEIARWIAREDGNL